MKVFEAQNTVSYRIQNIHWNHCWCSLKNPIQVVLRKFCGTLNL